MQKKATGKKKVGRFIVDLDQLLGEGSFAKVYLGIQAQTKQKVAVKVIDKSKIQQDEYTKKAFQQQIRIMMRLKSQNIIRFLDVNQTKSNFYIILQIADAGTLRDIMNNKKPLSQVQTIQYLIQLLNAFGQMFKIGIIHRDIKPDNIFVKKGSTGNHQNILKIGDFGFAKNKNMMESMMSTIVGSPAYMAPQILNEQKYTYKCDIWSLGIMAYQMVVGKLPFNFTSHNFLKLYQTIISQKIQFPQNAKISDPMKTFIRGCLQIKQQDRFSWVQVFLHPLFKGLFKKNFQQMKKGQQNLGYIMGAIRMTIHQNNINIKKQFHKLKKTQLNQAQFYQFLDYIVCEITKEQIQTLFQILKKNNVVSLTDFENILQKYGCKVKQLQVTQVSSQDQDNNLAKILIRRGRQQNKIDLYEMLSKNALSIGQINFQQFEAIIKKIAPKIPKHSVLQLYVSQFGISQKQSLSIDKFYKIMDKICEQVPKKK